MEDPGLVCGGVDITFIVSSLAVKQAVITCLNIILQSKTRVSRLLGLVKLLLELIISISPEVCILF